jgi:5-methyltetrahydrofolate corrinoid/iron sulfur protein methyltransferase
MIVVGELINASRKTIAAAIEKRDASVIQQVAVDQAAAGAGYIDVNAGIFVDREADCLKWLTETVQEVVSLPCALDSPDPDALKAALAVHKGTAMINSISLEKERFQKLIHVVAGTGLKVVALCMSDEGMPQTVDDRMRVADRLVNGLVRNGVSIDNIHIDPLVQPLSVNNRFGMEFILAIDRIMGAFPGIHTMCGLSNISFGLPNRKHLNQTFTAMAIARGLDGAIVNPLDHRMMGTIIAAEALAGRDDYCLSYIKAHRSGLFENKSSPTP